jgi:hypothetical protein
MQQKDLWAKKCPKCGHPALEHKYGKPGEPERDEIHLRNRITGKTTPPILRYCHHPLPSGVKDFYGFCLCEIDEDDYHRVGNYALIRVSKRKAEESKYEQV